MSASSKKKIRKAENEAKLTERQHKEKKEARRLRAYSIVFTILIIAIIAVTLFFGIRKIYLGYGLNQRWATAVKVGDHKINCVEMNYYYRYAVTNFMQQSGDSVSTVQALYGVDMSKPLNTQKYYNDPNKSWSDYFLEKAVELATSDYTLADAAEAAGYTLPADDQAALDNEFVMIQTQALTYGYTDLDEYVRAYFGNGATYKSYKAFLTRSYTAESYRAHYGSTIDVSEDMIAAYDANHHIDYTSFSYNTYTLNFDSFLVKETTTEDTSKETTAEDTSKETTTETTTEETADEDASESTEETVTYTEAEQQAAKDAAKAAAEELMKAKTPEELDAAIANLSINKDKDTKPSSTPYSYVLYASVQEEYQEWMKADDRKAGDTSMFDKFSSSTDEDDNTIKTQTGYTVVMFNERFENDTEKLDNVRHIFVALDADELTGETLYNEDSYANAEAYANQLLEEFKSGNATEADFIKLANEKSDDKDAEGGLYENISRYDNYYYTGTFNNDTKDWAVDAARKVGDTEVIRSDYGYHVMYYVGESDENYRHYSIYLTEQERLAEQWYNNLIATAKANVVVKNTKPMDFSTALYNTAATEE